jgi:hypothetical protein
MIREIVGPRSRGRYLRLPQSTQPDATQAQPEPFDDPVTLKEMQELFGKSGGQTFASWNQAQQ